MDALRIVYVFAAGLCLLTALLVTGSLFIADRTPQSMQFLVASMIVSGIFLMIGSLLLGVQSNLSRIRRLSRRIDSECAVELERRWFRLLVYMILGGLVLSAFLLIVTYAILARIDQGSAVFG